MPDNHHPSPFLCLIHFYPLQEAQWAKDDAEDADAIEGLMQDDPP